MIHSQQTPVPIEDHEKEREEIIEEDRKILNRRILGVMSLFHKISEGASPLKISQESKYLIEEFKEEAMTNELRRIKLKQNAYQRPLKISPPRKNAARRP